MAQQMSMSLAIRISLAVLLISASLVSGFPASAPDALSSRMLDTRAAEPVSEPTTTTGISVSPTPKTGNVTVLTLTPDVNHQLTIDHQNAVINLGQSLSMSITNAIVRPLTFLTNLIGSAAGSLPGIFAANGAALGTAIATPIQMGTLAANAAITGITGTVVSIPISLASGGAAQLVGLVGTGRQLWHSTLGSDPATSEFWQNGELWLQPLAVVTGSNSILAGLGLNALSQGVKNLGSGIESMGVQLSSAGKNVQRLGSVLVGWANGRPIYAQVVNDTVKNQLAIEFSAGNVNQAIGQQETTTTTAAIPIEIVANVDSGKVLNLTNLVGSMIPVSEPLEPETTTMPTTTTTTTKATKSKTLAKIINTVPAIPASAVASTTSSSL